MGKTLKYLSVNDYNYISDYYKDIFAILNVIDRLIQKIFTEKAVIYSYKEFNNKELGEIIYNTVVERMEKEHYTANFKSKLETDKYSMMFYLNNDNTLSELPHDRCTGKSTRQIDGYIQTAYHVPNSILYVTDHYTLENYKFRGSNSPSQADICLIIKLRNRLERELPENVFNSFVINKYNRTIIFTGDIKEKHINYKNFE